MEFTLDVKTFLTIGALGGTMAGFYYSTQHRLDTLEESVGEVSTQVDELSASIVSQGGELKQIQKQIRKLEK